ANRQAGSVHNNIRFLTKCVRRASAWALRGSRPLSFPLRLVSHFPAYGQESNRASFSAASVPTSHALELTARLGPTGSRRARPVPAASGSVGRPHVALGQPAL